MTSQTSSDSKILRHDIFTTIRQNLWLPIIGVIVLGILIPWSTYASNIFHNGISNGYSLASRLISQSSMSNPATIIFVIVLFAVGCACFSFKFAFDKKAVDAYFSIGLSRVRIFVSRSVAGIVMMFAGILIPMLIDLFINIAALGASGILFSSWLYLTCGFFVQGLVAFGVAAVVCAVVGNAFEGVTFSIGLLAAPTLLTQVFGELMKRFLQGYSLGMFSQFDKTPGLVTKLIDINPLLFFYLEINKFSYVTRGPKEYILEYMYFPALPQFQVVLLIGWLIVAAALVYLARFLFKRRRAEVAGSAGVSCVLNLTGQFVLAFFLFAELFCALDGGIGRAWAFVLAVLIFAAAFYLVGCAEKRSFKASVKSLKPLPIFLAAAVIILMIPLTGGFGFSGRVPAVSDVKSVTISYDNNPNYVPARGGSFSYANYNINCSPIFTSQKDIAAVIAVHKGIITAGTAPYTKNTTALTASTAEAANIKIIYKLKNGSTMDRYYNRTTVGALEGMLQLDNTDAVKALQASYVSLHQPSYDSQNYAYGTVFVADNCYSKPHKTPLTKQQRGELLACLRKDLAVQSVRDRYFPSGSARGLLIFGSGEVVSKKSGIRYFGFDLSSNIVYLTDSFKNTLGFLKKNGLDRYLSTVPDIESIEFARFNKLFNNYDGFGYSLYFISSYQKDQYDFYNKQFSGKITDSAKIASLMKTLRDDYFVKDGGYIARIKLKDQPGYVYKFLPYPEASPEIMNKIK